MTQEYREEILDIFGYNECKECKKSICNYFEIDHIVDRQPIFNVVLKDTKGEFINWRSSYGNRFCTMEKLRNETNYNGSRIYFNTFSYIIQNKNESINGLQLLF